MPHNDTPTTPVTGQTTDAHRLQALRLRAELLGDGNAEEHYASLLRSVA